METDLTYHDRLHTVCHAQGEPPRPAKNERGSMSRLALKWVYTHLEVIVTSCYTHYR